MVMYTQGSASVAPGDGSNRQGSASRIGLASVRTYHAGVGLCVSVGLGPLESVGREAVGGERAGAGRDGARDEHGLLGVPALRVPRQTTVRDHVRRRQLRHLGSHRQQHRSGQIRSGSSRGGAAIMGCDASPPARLILTSWGCVWIHPSGSRPLRCSDSGNLYGSVTFCESPSCGGITMQLHNTHTTTTHHHIRQPPDLRPLHST
jgi:hypothetical protein